jgi:broad specificity phosphatase PhoE
MKNLYFVTNGISQDIELFNTMGASVFYDKNFTDTKLTNTGVEQSIMLGQTWKTINDIQLIICSPLSRALETSRNIFQGLNIPIHAFDILKEYPQGLQTRNKSSSKESLINNYPEIDFTNVDEVDTMWLPQREETIAELDQRIFLLNEFLKKREETEIAIIGHSSFIGQYKDNKIGLIEKGEDELLPCHPYKIEFKL